MIRKHFVPGLLLFCSMSMLNNNSAVAQENPFFSEYKTPFQVPPFERIKPEHFMPAFEAGMQQQKEKVAAIYTVRSTPTFQNTIIPLESSDLLLKKVVTVFFNLTSAHTNPQLEKISSEIAPKLAQHHDDILLNPELFSRVKQVHENIAKEKLTPEEARLLDKTYKAFIRSGANLDEKSKERLRNINKELSSLTVKFGQNVLKEVNAYELVIDQKEDLSGLPEGLVNNAAKVAKESGLNGKWKFTLHNPSVMPFLEYADNRKLREQIYKAYTHKGDNSNEWDNNINVAQMVSLRAERSNLLGYSSYADFSLSETMAKTPLAVLNLLNNLWSAALPVAKSEAAEMQKLMDKKENGETLEAWDWFYYANKVKQGKYNFDAEELKPYFPLEQVKQGIFYVVQRLYGLSFTEIKDIPRYHPDIVAYEVKGANNNHVGVFYMDFFPRESKRGGAWMTSYRKQSANGSKVSPIVSIVCNFTPPNGNDPALLTPDEVETFFHEFGHALHGLLSNVKFESLAGTSVSRDFVELPSQFMEHYAFEKEVLNQYARHYKTGEVIPQALIEKMNTASKFNQGFATVEYLAASLLDMAYHSLPAGKQIKPDLFEQTEMAKIGLISQIAPRYRSTYFQHIFAGGYSAGYYSYIWSEVLDSDAFAAFKETGNIFDPKTAESFRKNILEKGGTVEPMVLYKNFRGKEPDIKYLLQNRGLEKPL
ncbi:M3 family metallopeptidase [Pseudopedobacter beijingensis]|uniref:M3 family metallopeptidase n=2 Tax=Pseudopedobacter beijingensis TaxID=1207056 RepID=A0ABW4IB65_9SPHI